MPITGLWKTGECLPPFLCLEIKVLPKKAISFCQTFDIIIYAAKNHFNQCNKESCDILNTDFFFLITKNIVGYVS